MIPEQDRLYRYPDALGSEYQLRELAKSRGYLHISTNGLLEKNGHKAFFDGLPVDSYLPNEVYQFRHRRYGRWLSAPDGTLTTTLRQAPFHQSTSVNPYAGGIERSYEPIDATTQAFIEKRLLPALLSLDFIPKDAYEIGVHPIRITADATHEGKPAPEGEHQDGFDYEALVCVARQNVQGALTTIFRPPLPFPRRSILETTMQPGEILVYDDRLVSHYTSPITPINSEDEAYRDMFIVTFKRREEPSAVEYHSFVDRQMLAQRFVDGLESRWITPEQYFVQNIQAVKTLYSPDAKHLYNNPFAEKTLLAEHLPEILPYIVRRALVFWGAGRKEANIVDAVAGQSSPNERTVIIDAEKEYIEDMTDLIHSETSGNRIIGIVSLFESFSDDEKRAFLRQLLDGKPAFHFCLGTTIGNFQQGELFRLFQHNMQSGDYLMLGFQLEKNPGKILNEYRDDTLLQEVVKLPLLAELEERGIGSHSWRYNHDKHQVEYLFTFASDYGVDSHPELSFSQGETIEVFRSKKYDLTQLVNELRMHNLQYTTHFEENDHCLLLVQRV